MTAPPPGGEQSRPGRWWNNRPLAFSIWLVGVAISLGTCLLSSDDDADIVDVAESTCGAWEGIRVSLTGLPEARLHEVHPRIEELQVRASLSNDPAVREAARALRAASSSGDPIRVAQASREMEAVC